MTQSPIAAIDPISATGPSSASGTRFGRLLSAVDPLQHLPGVGTIVRAAQAAAVGGPAAAAGTLAAGTLGSMVADVGAALAPAPKQGLAALPPGEPAHGYTPTVPPRTATNHITGSHDVAARALAALSAYDRTGLTGAAPTATSA